MRACAVVLVLGAAGCGRLGFDPYGGDDGTAALVVVPSYPGHAAWNTWVTNDNGGTTPWDQPDVTCAPDQPGTHHGCLHAGGLREVRVPDESSCADLTAADDLGALDWVCDDSSGTVVFRSTGLRAGARVAGLLDPAGTSFLQERVVVFRGAEAIAHSAPAAWWDNPIRPLPANPSGPVLVLDAVDDDGNGPDEAIAPGTILTLAEDRASTGYNLAEDELTVVVMPGARLSLASAATKNCNVTTGKTGPTSPDPLTYRPCLIAAGGQAFLWLEGGLDAAPGVAGENNSAVLLTDVRRAVVRELSTQNGAYGMLIEGGGADLLYDLRMMSHSNYGLIIETSAANVVVRAFFGNTSQGSGNGYGSILLSQNATGNLLSQIVTSSASQFGLIQFGPGNNDNTWSHVTVANTGHGVQMTDTSTTRNLTIWQLVDASSGEDGLHLGRLDGARLAELALIDDALAGIELDAAPTNTSYADYVLFGGNGQNCAGCTVPVGVTGVSVAGAFAGRGMTAAASSITDWTDLGSPYQSWGVDAAYGSAASRTTCNSGTCAVWDWRLVAGSTLAGRSGDGTTPNDPFVVDGSCPGAADGDRAITTAPGVTYLVNATEIMFDGRGNDDGLCESNEACVYSPNLGAYQGDGDYRGRRCAFADGAIAGVDLFAYPITSI
jgi:hypothetical protein